MLVGAGCMAVGHMWLVERCQVDAAVVPETGAAIGAVWTAGSFGSGLGVSADRADFD